MMDSSKTDDPKGQAKAIAQRLVKLKPVFLDTETTGLEAWDEVIEVGLIDFEGNVLLDTLIKPQGTIPAEASRVHGIRDRDVRNAPTWRQIWPQLMRLLSGRHLAIYNAEFDLRLMRQSHARAQMSWHAVTKDTHCIMKLYAQYRGEWNLARGNYRWHRLEAAGRQCGIRLPNTHRAKDDAMLARAVLLHMVQA